MSTVEPLSIPPTGSVTASLLQQALSLHQRGQLSQAEGLYRQILQLEPEHAEALLSLAALCVRNGASEQSIALLERYRIDAAGSNGAGAAPRESPSSVLRWGGDQWSRQARPDVALMYYERSLGWCAEDANTHNNLGIVLERLRCPEKALLHYQQALRIRPDFPEALTNHGNALYALGRAADALMSFERALELRPAFPEAHNNRGNVLRALGRLEEALASYEQALVGRADLLQAQGNRGQLLLDLQRPTEALACFEAVLRAAPGDADAHFGAALALLHLHRSDEALQGFDRASACGIEQSQILVGRAAALAQQHKHREAAEHLERLLALDPDYDYALGSLLQSRLHCCNWTGLPDLVAALSQRVALERKATYPQSLLAAMDDPALQRRCAERCAADRFPARTVDRVRPVDRGGGSSRLRVAYVSGDFRQHPVSHLLVGVLEGHDRRRLEVIGVSLRAAEPGVFERRVQRAFDRWIELQDRGDRAAAQLLRELQVDVAVDLMGFTQDMRLGIFSHRAAPVQVGYLGYAGTLGAPYMDYLIADEVVIPRGQEGWYAEQVVRLPHCYLPYDDRRELGVVPTRAAAGLPDRGLVFCAFTNSYKLNPQMFDVWMRLLRAVPDSVLWLRSGGEVMMENLRREAQARAVGSERLVFAEHVPSMAQHLARQGLADVFLDTLPYNAHSTACDALWAGVPVLTCAGSGFASRVAASAVRAAGVPELITQSLEQYEQLGLRLAREPQYLQGLKARLRANRGSAALFDTGGYCRALEAAYAGMVERSRGGQSALGFDVPPQALARGALA